MGKKIQSMTGYGFYEGGGFRIEIRSVNHRYLDTFFKMPPFLNHFEMDLRKVVRERFARGRLDIAISFTEESERAITINHKFAEQLLNTLRDLQKELSLKEGPSLDHLFWFRDIIFSEKPAYDPQNLFSAFRGAVDVLSDMRAQEGEFLIKEVLGHIDSLEHLLNRLRETSRNMTEKTCERLKQKISSLLRE
jgi:uncharacterized protein (TIGR00255 family)